MTLCATPSSFVFSSASRPPPDTQPDESTERDVPGAQADESTECDVAGAQADESTLRADAEVVA